MFREGVFKGRIAIVTGGGTGLGKAIARRLAALGADVAIASRNRDHLEPARGELEACGGRVMAEVCDIRDPEQVERFVEQVTSTLGRIDILVNNGGGQFPKQAEEITPGGWRAVVDTNLNGTWFMTQSVARRMIPQGGGKVIHVIGNFVYRGAPGVVHSVAARAGVAGMTATLAREWGRHGITVNAIAPGIFITEGAREEMMSGMPAPGLIDRLAAAVPIGRLGRVEEFADVVAFFASPMADYITGQVLFVDGGNAIGGGLDFVGV